MNIDMLLIWSGWGFLVVPIVVAVSVLVGAGLQVVFAAANHPELAFLASSIGLLAGAGANWIVGTRLNNRPGRELIDPKNNQRVMLRRISRFFWIPMQWWSVPVALAALLALRNPST